MAATRRLEVCTALGALALAAGLAVPAGAAAQQGDGFRFGAPRGSFAVRAGLHVARAEGDLLGQATSELTLERGDFDGGTVAGEIAITARPRLDVVLGLGYARASAPSESREYVEENDEPIRQTTELTQVPVTASVRLYLTERGRSIGRYAWIPAGFAPYVGGGLGAVSYKLVQEGDFVDESDLSIHTDRLDSGGLGFAALAFAGADLRLGTSSGLLLEARGTWAGATPDDDYVGFDRIDLSGLQVLAGLYVRF